MHIRTDKSNLNMAKLPPLRRLLKLFHFEGIPWPVSVFYNFISTTGMFQRHYELIARDILSYCEGGSLLDIGTGPAWLLAKLHQHSSGMRLVGIDASPSMVVKARKNMVDAGMSDFIEIKEGNASRIPFADRSFDIVISTGSIHHWKAPAIALNDVYRVLKADSYALMYDLVSDTPVCLLNEMAREFGKLKTMMFWLHSFEEPFYTRQNFTLLAQSTLFREGQTQFVGVLCCLILKKEAATNLKDTMPTKSRNN